MLNYFFLFELQQAFDIDLSALEKKYFSAQMRFHPDRLIGKSAIERQQSIHQSMIINEAYETLKTPLKRALHMLQLEGITQDSIKASQDLLMEIMELREKLADAGTQTQLQAISSQTVAATERTKTALSEAFSRADNAAAAQLAMRLSYLLKLAEEIRIKKKALA